MWWLIIVAVVVVGFIALVLYGNKLNKEEKALPKEEQEKIAKERAEIQAEREAAKEAKRKADSEAYMQSLVEKQKKAGEPVKCPKCGSTQISADKKGYSVGKAVVGKALVGNVGLAAGAHGSDKVIVTCLKCGHQWKAGKAK